VSTVTQRRNGAAGRSGPTIEDGLTDRLSALSAELAVTPDEDYRAATRARLVAMAALRAPEGNAVRRPQASPGALRRLFAPGPGAAPPRWHNRLTAGLAGAALTVTALGGVLAVSHDARPGDLLYDLKLGSEKTQLALADDATRGVTLLGFATTRLQELTDLARQGASALPGVGAASAGGQMLLAAGPDVAVVVDTLTAMDGQTTEGSWWLTTQAMRSSDPAALSTLTGWAREQSAGLVELGSSIPAGAEQAFTASADLLAAVAGRGAALQEAVVCAGGPATHGTDDLGAVPAPCPSPAAPTGTPTTAALSSRGQSTGSAPAPTSTAGTGPSGPTDLPNVPASSSVGAGPTPGDGATTVTPPGTGGGSTPTAPSTPGSLPAPDQGGLPVPLPTRTPAASSTPPLIELPLPVVPSGSPPVCVGRLICIGP
jgi:hypothetical protein